MASHTLTTTPEQDQVIAFVLEMRNAERAAQVPPLPAWDVEALFNHYLESVVDQYREAALEAHRGQLIESYEAASPEDRVKIDATLGLIKDG